MARRESAAARSLAMIISLEGSAGKSQHANANDGARGVGEGPRRPAQVREGHGGTSERTGTSGKSQQGACEAVLETSLSSLGARNIRNAVLHLAEHLKGEIPKER